MSAGLEGKDAWFAGLKLTYPTAFTLQKLEGSLGGKTLRFMELEKKLATFLRTSAIGTPAGAGFLRKVSIF